MPHWGTFFGTGDGFGIGIAIPGSRFLEIASLGKWVFW
ncbi:hypothetical protein C943_03862 [Mariniradius saccharolyticus AK6]|uniref:Uncharacterized protein n=1 Tax=Mariniradius saccharolyticus AK6 TaxID=1239962 RepID=M7YA43_9BACT|nr:hypothetical protein C943_03862 [Mariniradius saccharolyticus AK6]